MSNIFITHGGWCRKGESQGDLLAGTVVHSMTGAGNSDQMLLGNASLIPIFTRRAAAVAMAGGWPGKGGERSAGKSGDRAADQEGDDNELEMGRGAPSNGGWGNVANKLSETKKAADTKRKD
jgi:hypothetical protein